jgi:hypothetical protein
MEERRVTQVGTQKFTSNMQYQNGHGIWHTIFHLGELILWHLGLPGIVLVHDRHGRQSSFRN